MVERKYLSLQDLCTYASLSRKTIAAYLSHPLHPLPHFRLSGKILVDKADFDLWLAHYRIAEAPGEAVDLDQLVDNLMDGIELPSRKKELGS
jgi:hypothetical protein